MFRYLYIAHLLTSNLYPLCALSPKQKKHLSVIITSLKSPLHVPWVIYLCLQADLVNCLIPGIYITLENNSCLLQRKFFHPLFWHEICLDQTFLIYQFWQKLHTEHLFFIYSYIHYPLTTRSAACHLWPSLYCSKVISGNLSGIRPYARRHLAIIFAKKMPYYSICHWNPLNISKLFAPISKSIQIANIQHNCKCQSPSSFSSTKNRTWGWSTLYL